MNRTEKTLSSPSMQQLGKIFFKYLIIMLFLGACSRFQRIQKNGTVEEKYQAAVEYYEQKDYYRSATLLEELIPLLKGTEQAEKAQYYYAYAHYEQQQYVLSAFYFKTFYETFPRSPYAEEATFLYAMSLYKDSPRYNLDQTNTFTALDAFQNFLTQYPETKKTEEINGYIDALNEKLERKQFEQAKLYYHKEQYKSAVVALENFRKEYTESAFAEEAAYLKISAAYNLAKNSTEAKQAERYQQAITFYENFIDKYPKSKFIRLAEEMYDNAKKEINRK